jgi:hypothetical protein
MKVTLDGQSLFGKERLEIKPGSRARDSMERTVPGVDGVLSIDLGGRGRQIKQRGVLRAKSRAEMEEKVGAISAYMDGDTHALVTDNGEEYGSLRMDSFVVSNERLSGSGVAVDYEIIYTQVKV